MQKECPPDPNDRSYFPIDNDLRNHIYMAKKAIQLSCLDQENLCLKIEQWKKTDPESTHYFRPYCLKSEVSEQPSHEAVSEERTNQYEQNFLWVH